MWFGSCMCRECTATHVQKCKYLGTKLILSRLFVHKVYKQPAGPATYAISLTWPFSVNLAVSAMDWWDLLSKSFSCLRARTWTGSVAGALTRLPLERRNRVCGMGVCRCLENSLARCRQQIQPHKLRSGRQETLS